MTTLRSLFLFWALQCTLVSTFAQPLFAKGYEHPQLSDSASWTMILLPDLQNYVKFHRNQPLLDIMMNWIVENRERLNIRNVLCTGDLVDADDIENPEFAKTDQTGRQQWKAVVAAFSKLDGVVPYVTCTGNHDYNLVMASRRGKVTSFPTYFPPEKNILNQQLLREIAPNVDGIPSLENAFYEWISPHGVKFLFLALEFAPRDTLLRWSRSVVALPKYQQHKVILLTHSFLSSESQQVTKEGYQLEDANYGKAMWEKLIYPSSNFSLVLSGHIAGKDLNDARGHVGFRTDEDSKGRVVDQLTFNAQRMGGGGYGSGGDGWLRILEFMPDKKTVKVKTFSPVFALSTTTQPLAWRKESFDEFSFVIQ